jgi:F-type H+-transporting ATPase subunit alpha
MKQKQYAPFSVAEMAVSLFIVEKGYLDDVPVAEVSAFEAAIQGFMHSSYAALMHKINEAGAYDDAIETQLKAAVEEFKRTGSW